LRTLFIGVFADSVLINYINNISNNSSQVSFAAIKFSKSIADGLESNSSDHVNLFLIPIGVYPNCKKFIFYKKGNNNNYYIPFVNILFLKQLCISIYVFLFVVNWCILNFGHKKYLFTGFLYLPFLFAIQPLKYFQLFNFISFVPDLPKFIFSYTKKQGIVKAYFQSLYIKITNKLSHKIDYYVFITKYMAEYFPNKPFSIIEGFSSPCLDYDVELKISKNAILYAGALYEKFGIKTLINVFNNLPGNYELWLFGYGDMIEYISQMSKSNPKILFFGNISNSLVLDYQKKARLLVNPRPINHEFTKYSFPSKILEYMSSGTPVLTTKLAGIPPEYDDKLLYFEDDSYNGIMNGLVKYLNYSDDELFEIGNKSIEFIRVQKNNDTQISNLISRIKYLV
jgi:glycosyltransferase involved in cell wall biosynthesis